MKVSEGEEKYAMKAKQKKRRLKAKSQRQICDRKHHGGENGKSDGDKKEKTETKHIEKVKDVEGSDYVGQRYGLMVTWIRILLEHNHN